MRQRAGNDCGPAALATVAASHGRTVDYAALVRGLRLVRDGTDLLAVSRAAHALGLAPRGVRASFDALEGCRLPAIAHLRSRLGGGHFVVVERWAPTHVELTDPAHGRRTVSRRAFGRRWSGYLLLVGPADAP